MNAAMLQAMRGLLEMQSNYGGWGSPGKKRFQNERDARYTGPRGGVVRPSVMPEYTGGRIPTTRNPGTGIFNPVGDSPMNRPDILRGRTGVEMSEGKLSERQALQAFLDYYRNLGM